MTNIATVGGVIGAVNPDERTADPQFALNTQVVAAGLAADQGGYTYRYVQDSGSGIAASQTDVAVTTAGAASDGLGTYVNTTAFAANEYGWVRNPVIAADAT